MMGATDSSTMSAAHPHFATAAYFARSRQQPGVVGTVWECFVDPDRLHAFVSDEREYVADVRGLPIVERGLAASKRPRYWTRLRTRVGSVGP